MNPVEIRWTRRGATPVQVSAGGEHCVALVSLSRSKHRRDAVAYAWGNPANGRLGPDRDQNHATPMEVEDVSEALRKSRRKIRSLAAGGSHTLAVLDSGEVAAWGEGGYGQLGDGHMWDRAEPVMVTGLQGVQGASAGCRHSMALVVDAEGTHVWGWGFNRWGELGCGDCNVRLQPQRVRGFDGCTVERVVAGERHTIALTDGKARRVEDLPEYRGFVDAYRKGGLLVYDALRRTMSEKGLNPDWLDTPLEFFPGQPGMTDSECRPSTIESGMEWCMDVAPPGKDGFDKWRGGHEVVYVCRPCRRLRVCLACARRCHWKHHIEPSFRLRDSREPCDCSSAGGLCTCKWSPMRDKFRFIAARSADGPTIASDDVGKDGSLHPSDLRELLQVIRGGAAFVTSEDVSDGVAHLTQGGEHDRIHYVPFERWYEEYFGKKDAELENA